MENNIEKYVRGYLKSTEAISGFAPVGRFSDAPKGHHPADLCRDAATVIVLGIPIPRGVLTSPAYGLHATHRSYHTVYRQLDEISLGLCNFLEEQGHEAVMVPSYAPMVFHELEPWGLLSLKHAAVKAGLGSMGRSGLMYHPHFGARLRLGAVVTSAEMPGNDVIESDPCPSGCSACWKNCPASAFSEDGFAKMACLGHTIKHAIYPLALKSAEGLAQIERIINTAGHDYWIDCITCLKVCPNNR